MNSLTLLQTSNAKELNDVWAADSHGTLVSGKRPRILVAESDGFSPAAVDRLSRLADLALGNFDRPRLVSAVRQADVLWVRLRHRIDDEIMRAAPQLKFVVSPTTGLDHIDLNAAYRRRVEVISLRGEVKFLRTVRATAEHTIGLMLALLRNIPAASQQVLDGRWDRDRFRGRELYQATVGVVGYGRLGRIVARYLTALGARVLAADPCVQADDVEPDVQWTQLRPLLEQADIVTVHVDLNRKTRGLFGAEEFRRMKRGAVLVNTSRGALLDEVSLLQALQTGRLGGAALDVLAHEGSAHLADDPLVQYARKNPNLIITPHLGGCTKESMEKAELFLARKLCDALAISARP